MATLPALAPELTSGQAQRALWEAWQEGLNVRFTLLDELPPLRLLLVLDNLTGHKSAELVCWFMAHGIMPLYTPLAGSWLNMAESIQRILVHRTLSGQHPESAAQLMDWLAATVRGWNAAPTPFEWGARVPPAGRGSGRGGMRSVAPVRARAARSDAHAPQSGPWLMAVSMASDPLVVVIWTPFRGGPFLGTMPQ